ncbi:MAG: SDR family NAD(P)-dependent oxidoreductase [Enterobacter hormaechei]
MADAAQASDVCGRLLSSLERLDVLVNAAGILRMGATDQLSQEDWQQTFAVNVGARSPVPADDGPVPSSAGRGDCDGGSDAAHTPRIGMAPTARRKRR